MELKKAKYKSTEIGLIPVDWRATELEEVALIVGGGTPSTSVNQFWNGQINWFTPTEIGVNKFVHESDRKITDLGLKNSSAQILPKGAILLTTRASIGDLAIITKEACTNQGFQSLIPKNGYDNEFLYYSMQTKQKDLITNSSGSTFLEISPKKVKKILIACPPTLHEQKAIATALSDVDSLISSLDKLITKKKAIKQGAMQELLTPKDGWKTRTTQGLCDKLWIGLVTTMTTNYVKNGVPLVRNSDIRVNKFNNDLINLEVGFANKHKSRAFALHDVITVHTGDVGTSAVVPDWLDGAQGFATINSRLKRSIILPHYYSYYLNSPLLKKQLVEVITGDGRSNLNLYDFVNLTISYPTLKEQQEIVEILSDMDAEIEALEVKKTKYQDIKQGMMQELLTGKTRLI